MHRPLPLLVAACGLLSAADSLSILPGSVELNSPETRQHLLAEARLGDHQEDWTRKVEGRSSNPKVAIVDANGEVRPMDDGQATISATAEGRSATATVPVKGSQVPSTFTFPNDLIPALTNVGSHQR